MDHSALAAVGSTNPRQKVILLLPLSLLVRRELEDVLESVGLSLFHTSLIILEL